MDPQDGDHPAFISQGVTQARRFYLNLNPSKSSELVVLCGGWERCAANYANTRPSFPNYVVEFVVGGKGWLDLDGKSYALHRGAAFAYGPAISHSIRTSCEERLSKYFLDVDGYRCVPLLEDSGILPGSFRIVAEPDAVEAAFEQVVSSGLSGGRQVARIVALLTEVLLLRISERNTTPRLRYGSYQTFARCRSLLDENYLELCSAESAAKACNVDPAYLSRLFAQNGCEPPYRYLTRKKMAHAAELLHGGGVIVREVADRLGMDPFQFSKSFKRSYGIAPSTFLARHRGRADQSN